MTDLRYLYNLVIRVEQAIMSDPYDYSFFEPYYASQGEAPLERDYQALIQQAYEAGDDELVAKWAFL